MTDAGGCTAAMPLLNLAEYHVFQAHHISQYIIAMACEIYEQYVSAHMGYKEPNNIVHCCLVLYNPDIQNIQNIKTRLFELH